MAELPPLFVKLGAQIGEFQAAFATAEKELASFNRSHETSAAGWQASAMKIQAASRVVGVGMLAAGAYAVKQAADFQSSQEKLVTTAGESRKNLDMVSQGILQMAGQVGYSAKDLSQGMYTVESAGFHGAQGLTVLKAAAQGAREEGASLGDVTNAVTTVLKDFRGQAGSAAQVTSGLIRAVSLGKTTFQDLTGSLHSVLPVAQAAGLKWTEMAADLSQMTVHGESAEQAAQNMRFAIQALTKPTGAQAKAMADFGVQAHDVSQKLSSRGLAGTMQYLSDHVMAQMGASGAKLKSVMNQSGLAAQDAAKMMQALPPEAAAVAKSYESGSMSVGDYRKALKALPANQQAVITQWKSQYDASQGFSNVLKSGSDTAMTYNAAMAKMTGGQAALNVAMMLTRGNSKDVNYAIQQVGIAANGSKTEVAGFSDTQHTLAFQMQAAKAAINALAIQLGTTLLPILTPIVKKFTDWLTVMSRHPEVLKAIVAAIGSFAAVGSVLMPIISTFMKLHSAIGTVSTAVKDAGGIVKVFQMGLGALTSPVGIVVAALAVLGVAIYEIVKHWQTIKRVTSETWQSIKSNVVDAAQSIGGPLAAAWGVVERETGSAWTSIKTTVGGAAKAVESALSSAWASVKSATSAAWDAVKHATEVAWEAISGFFRKWWPLLLVIFAPGVALIVGIWNRFHSQMIASAKAQWALILAFFRGVWQEIHGVFTTATHDVESVLNAAWQAVSTAAKAAWAILLAYFRGVWQQIKAVFESATHSVESVLSSAWRTVSSATRQAWDDIRKAVSDALQSLVQAVQRFAQPFVSAFSNMIQQARSAMSNVGSWFMSVGQNIVSGIIQGVESGASSLFSSLQSMANNALNSAKSALGIHSPSRVMAEQVGVWIPRGIAVGIAAEGKSATEAVKQVVDKVTATASKTVANVNVTTGTTVTRTKAEADAQKRAEEAVLKAKKQAELDAEKAQLETLKGLANELMEQKRKAAAAATNQRHAGVEVHKEITKLTSELKKNPHSQAIRDHLARLEATYKTTQAVRARDLLTEAKIERLLARNRAAQAAVRAREKATRAMKTTVATPSYSSTSGSSGSTYTSGSGSSSSGSSGTTQTLKINMPLTLTLDGRKVAEGIQPIALQYQMRNGRPMFSLK